MFSSASLLFHGLIPDPMLPTPLQHQCLPSPQAKILLFAVPTHVSILQSIAILLPCNSSCQEKGEEGHFWLITTSFGTSRPRPREKLQPDVQNFPSDLLKLLTKFDKFGINHWKTSEIDSGVPEILTPWSSSWHRLSKPRLVHFSQFMRFISGLSWDADRNKKLVCVESISSFHSHSWTSWNIPP